MHVNETLVLVDSDASLTHETSVADFSRHSAASTRQAMQQVDWRWSRSFPPSFHRAFSIGCSGRLSVVVFVTNTVDSALSCAPRRMASGRCMRLLHKTHFETQHKIASGVLVRHVWCSQIPVPPSHMERQTSRKSVGVQAILSHSPRYFGSRAVPEGLLSFQNGQP